MKSLIWPFVACFMFVIVMGVAADAALRLSGNSETIQNASGSTIGYIDGKTVYDKNRKIIGYVDENGTYDANRKKILKSKQPGILFCKYIN
jgi:uncharacterized protein YcfJ